MKTVARAKTAAPLEVYRAKRDFARTREPKGSRKTKAGSRTSSAAGGAYVIQKHRARRLHFDFRLELDGVLKSWAVTKGPSLDPAEKRLGHLEKYPIWCDDRRSSSQRGRSFNP
jgi:bifunctional non-homologous end joining protein LigD